VLRNRVYRHGRLDAENVPPQDLSEHLVDPSTVVWVDLCAPRADELELVAEELDLHALAVQDALGRRQRPKVDHYPTHLFCSAFETRLDPTTGRVELNEVAAFVTARALVTVRKSESFGIEEVVRRWDDEAHLAAHGVAFLLHGLLDHVVDSHFEALQVLDDESEALEDLLFEERSRSTQVQRRSFELRKSLVLLRHVVLPMREVVNTLIRRDWQGTEPGLLPYYQDLYDHVLRVSEWTDSLRDMVATILETNLTIQGNRLNEIMKKVTSWAAIIGVPTAITGFYGQNVPYPGFGNAAGFVASTAAILAASAVLYGVFRRANWL
jgi:magnesium transporter